MTTRDAGRGARGRQAALAALALTAGLSLAACGSNSFPNDPRPPAPLEVSAEIGSGHVKVSPNRFGAGLVTFTVANLSSSPVRFTISGPKNASSTEIQPDAPGSLKVNMTKGTYQAGAGTGSSASPTTIRVGTQRPSPQNKVLLP